LRWIRPVRWPYAGGILDVAWAAFSVANLIAIVMYPGWETVPFHFIWVSLTIVYGFRVWSLPTTWMVLFAVCLTTGILIAREVSLGDQLPGEFTEVPLMAAMFLAMVWHARRRLAMMRSLEQLSQYNVRLLEQQREFIANASHELRTPITIALGHAELIASGLEAGTMSDDAQVVIDELDRLRRLSNRMLALAAPEGRDFLHWSVIDVQSLVEDIAQRWLPTDRHWSVETSTGTTVMGDYDRLVLAIDALIENAVSNTMPGDAIRLFASTRDDTVAVGVSDMGKGIAAADLERIFDRSTQLDSGEHRETAGNGLGLSIVMAVAKAHGGDVAVTSQLGFGACFTLRLPTADVPRCKEVVEHPRPEAHLSCPPLRLPTAATPRNAADRAAP
jgi:signal transduction histidine kinase